MKQHIDRINQLLTDEFGDKPKICALATVDVTGRATVRTMVARELSVTGGLLFVSDRRTHKDDHLRERPLCEVCFWLPKQNIQVRLQGEAVIVDAMDDESMRQQWWSKMDARGVRIFTGIEGDPDDVRMPTTFELITITPTWIEIGDYKQVPPDMSTWSE
ncbi:MAG: pyridoxamine 5'-phosphate oxidase family protein [Tepidisphaeraceae bacterium]